MSTSRGSRVILEIKTRLTGRGNLLKFVNNLSYIQKVHLTLCCVAKRVKPGKPLLLSSGLRDCKHVLLNTVLNLDSGDKEVSKKDKPINKTSRSFVGQDSLSNELPLICQLSKTQLATRKYK